MQHFDLYLYKHKPGTEARPHDLVGHWRTESGVDVEIDELLVGLTVDLALYGYLRPDYFYEWSVWIVSTNHDTPLKRVKCPENLMGYL